MPIPKSEAAKRKVVRGAIRRKGSRGFKSGSANAIARETLAKKIMKQGKSESQAYAIATSVIKDTVKRRK